MPTHRCRGRRVIQGWTWGVDMRHADADQGAGIDISTFPAGGVGSVCRHQSPTRAGTVLACQQDARAKRHSLVFKTRRLTLAQDSLTSADSLAWSYTARRKPPPECVGRHEHCGNCMRAGLRWSHRVTRELLGRDVPRPRERAAQGRLF
jgi:hypothetical protein